MRRLLMVLVLLAVGIVGVGFYRGWFRFSTDNTGDKVNTTDNKTNYTITVDKDKIHADEEKVKEKVHAFGHKAKE